MKRLVGPMPFLLIGLAGGCTCKAAPRPGSAETLPAAPSATASAAVGDAPVSEAVFSAPIAAVQVAGVEVVAGLVAAEGLVRAMGFRKGHVAWKADAPGKVAWAPDAEIKLSPAGDGVALVSRGLKAKSDRTLVLLGPHGEPRSEPIDIGAAFCTTMDGFAWVDPRPVGPVRVRSRSWSQTETSDAVTIAPDRRPALVCGDHEIFVLGDGDDDLTLTAFVPGDAAAKPPIVAIRDADFRGDDEREHYTYSMGDDLGLLRLADSGSISIREVSKAGAPTPWRKLKHSLSEDDDVVAVDGDAAATLVVFTHEADDACPGVGSTADSVRALRVDRATGEESMLDLARPNCEVSPGPFWIAAAPGAPVIAWVERATKVSPAAAAIRGLATRALRPDGVKPGHIDIQADALVDGGCDEHGCFAAALIRDTGADGMLPAAISAVAYP
jgi:hypothetical protein